LFVGSLRDAGADPWKKDEVYLVQYASAGVSPLSEKCNSVVNSLKGTWIAVKIKSRCLVEQNITSVCRNIGESKTCSNGEGDCSSHLWEIDV